MQTQAGSADKGEGKDWEDVGDEESQGQRLGKANNWILI